MKSLIYTLLTVAASFVLFSCNTHSSGNTAEENKDSVTIISQTFKTDEGWGYAVFLNDKLFIRQSIIPVIEGNKAFATEEDAKKVAALVVDKLRRHEKPIVRMAELQQFGLAKTAQ